MVYDKKVYIASFMDFFFDKVWCASLYRFKTLCSGLELVALFLLVHDWVDYFHALLYT